MAVVTYQEPALAECRAILFQYMQNIEWICLSSWNVKNEMSILEKDSFWMMVCVSYAFHVHYCNPIPPWMPSIFSDESREEVSICGCWLDLFLIFFFMVEKNHLYILVSLFLNLIIRYIP